jgi:hypothetical protein
MRTKFAKDKKKRKTRSDKIHKHRRNGNLIKYVSNRHRDDPVKVWFWQKLPMSRDGYMRFPAHLRMSVTKNVYKFVGKPILVDPNVLSSKDAIADLAVSVIRYPGTFLLMMCGHAQNTHHTSYRKKAIIRIDENEEGLRGKVLWQSMYHYWFYKDK